MVENVAFDSELFCIKRLADGVYALIEREDRTGSNAGIIDLGNETVVFDTFLNIDAAEDMKRACVALTGKMPSVVINSHSHGDHIIGNCLFPQARIISSEKTREAVAGFKEAYDRDRPEYAGREREIRDMLPAVTDATERKNLKNELNFVENMAKPHAAIRVPDTTFDGEMALYGDNRTLHLRVYPVGHSPGDVTACLPEDKIVFAGDLLFIGQHPWLGRGEPEALIGILEGLMDSDMEHFVPGHGRMAGKEDVVLVIRYIQEIMALAESKKGIEGAAFSVAELSPEFREWNDLCFQWNMRFLMERG